MTSNYIGVVTMTYITLPARSCFKLSSVLFSVWAHQSVLPWRRMEKIKWSEKVTNGQVLEGIGEKTLLNNILRRKSSINWSYSEKKCSPSWWHWRTDDGSEMSRKKKNTAPWRFEKQEKILRKPKVGKVGLDIRNKYNLSSIRPWTC